MNVFLVMAALVFMISVYGLLSSRNMVRMLISIEVMFNSVVLAVLSLGSQMAYLGRPEASGTAASLVIFAIGLAISEIVLMFSIMIGILRLRIVRNVDTEEMRAKER